MSNNKIDFPMLLASSVHDIKNSLGMLLNSLESMIDINDSDTEKRHQFSVLHGEASRINHSLIHLLGLYRLDNNQLSINNQEVYLEDFLEEQAASQQLLFDINNIKLNIHCDPNLSGYFDENLIAGVVGNILVNCAKYTQDRIDIYCDKVDAGIVIQIKDNGSGYPQSIIDKLSNNERSLDFNTGSTNLGLFFAAEIAKLHRCKEKTGSISLSNHDNGGCFTLSLP
ncbi:HAMP domain-containing histidine kinase [Dasania sp. GY-MA-18]|uniref:histidine kinase n=1 Tax=Dasania phycosphaerae TaxID=2950436 RepID=A0A9J6RIZ9_9GAMM|nr:MULTISPECIES: HAMP domain-containing sensor histidine kinase [Dasania]MCR8921747.1 HAMP domain-containing histidine kinase [Dasania sp. GY-MA-18]MCZ0864175.1 HAMP domain-containing sensor histidine kinase [Dasania phycosphaerae]MCZ0867903.1 HAMP domain-containing sensor histidine kinase [Dasania phycosphaerae]